MGHLGAWSLDKVSGAIGSGAGNRLYDDKHALDAGSTGSPCRPIINNHLDCIISYWAILSPGSRYVIDIKSGTNGGDAADGQSKPY